MRGNKVPRQPKLLHFQKGDIAFMVSGTTCRSLCKWSYSIDLDFKCMPAMYVQLSITSALDRDTELFISFGNSGPRVAIDLYTSLPKVCGLQWPHG